MRVVDPSSRVSWPIFRRLALPVRLANPYAELRALVDTTRRLDPVEVAELQLEQGYVERALRIYDELHANDPSNAEFARRRAWLQRMSSVQARPTRTAGVRVEAAPRPERALPERTLPERTLRGIRSPVAPPEPSEAEDRKSVAVVARQKIVCVG